MSNVGQCCTISFSNSQLMNLPWHATAGEGPFPGGVTRPGDHLRNVFYRMGFGDQEIVALSGRFHYVDSDQHSFLQISGQVRTELTSDLAGFSAAFMRLI